MELNDLIIQELEKKIQKSYKIFIWQACEYDDFVYESTFPIKQPDMYFDFTNIA